MQENDSLKKTSQLLRKLPSEPMEKNVMEVPLPHSWYYSSRESGRGLTVNADTGKHGCNLTIISVDDCGSLDVTHINIKAALNGLLAQLDKFESFCMNVRDESEKLPKTYQFLREADFPNGGHPATADLLSDDYILEITNELLTEILEIQEKSLTR